MSAGPQTRQTRSGLVSVCVHFDRLAQGQLAQAQAHDQRDHGDHRAHEHDRADRVRQREAQAVEDRAGLGLGQRAMAEQLTGVDEVFGIGELGELIRGQARAQLWLERVFERGSEAGVDQRAQTRRRRSDRPRFETTCTGR